MKQRFFIVVSFLFSVAVLVAQVDCKIYQLPTFTTSTSSQNKVQSSDIRTSGVVTSVVYDGNVIKGFYLQDKIGDGNLGTCDAIFVSTENPTVAVGNEVEIVATLNSEGSSHVLNNLSSLQKIADNQSVTPVKVIFPNDFSNYSLYEGMLLEFDQTLFVTNNYYWGSGRVILSSYRLNGPVEVALPGTSEYATLVVENQENQLTMVSSPLAAYPFADINSTLRMGYRVDNLRGTLVKSGSYYQLEVPTRPNFYGNPRAATHEDIGDYNVKVCGFNMEYYLRSSYGDFAGPVNETEANRQHSKLLQAFMAIDADIYGLAEIQQGSGAISYMCNAMNEAAGADLYTYVSDGTSPNGSYTKCGYIYRKDKISTVGTIDFNNTKLQNRKVIQAFSLKSNGEKFIFSMNHLKAKGKTYETTPVDDLDSGDGQSSYNATRVAEVASIISRCTNFANTIDPDVLIMGDMNAHSKEDPIRKFETAGYTNLLKLYHGDTIYSYSYKGEVGLLDHAIANNSMKSQVTGATVFHINTDEDRKFEYQNTFTFQDNMYRSSDHDPVVVGLRLKSTTDTVNPSVDFITTNVIPNTIKDGLINIYDAPNMDVTITDLQGRIFYNANLPNESLVTFSIDALGISQGYYLVRLLDRRSDAIPPLVFKIVVR